MLISSNSVVKNLSPKGRPGGAGLYIHIPFCKQACHYCDFHFSTSLRKKGELIAALVKELQLRKDEFQNETMETIYFGGGTPSLLTIDELRLLIDTVYENYKVAKNPEITLEANPDDLVIEKLSSPVSHSGRQPGRQAGSRGTGDVFMQYQNIGINRLSIGIQSFFEEDLKLMNRAHNAEEAKKCIEEATKHFENISIDLIYGIPGMSNERWLQNVETALSFGVPHISSYALTVEPKTALQKFIEKGIIAPVDDELAQQHFMTLVETLEASNFVHYELSNFGKEGFFSRNNTAYWLGKKYLGIGPSAHSYNGLQRSWNVANNTKYMKSLDENILPSEEETLTKNDRYNEYVMTGLRTIWGVSLERVEKEFGPTYKNYLLQQAEKYLKDGLLQLVASGDSPAADCIGSHSKVITTKKGKFLADGIASDLFILS